MTKPPATSKVVSVRPTLNRDSGFTFDKYVFGDVLYYVGRMQWRVDFRSPRDLMTDQARNDADKTK